VANKVDLLGYIVVVACWCEVVLDEFYFVVNLSENVGWWPVLEVWIEEMAGVRNAEDIVAGESVEVAGELFVEFYDTRVAWYDDYYRIFILWMSLF